MNTTNDFARKALALTHIAEVADTVGMNTDESWHIGRRWFSDRIETVEHIMSFIECDMILRQVAAELCKVVKFAVFNNLLILS